MKIFLTFDLSVLTFSNLCENDKNQILRSLTIFRVQGAIKHIHFNKITLMLVIIVYFLAGQYKIKAG